VIGKLAGALPAVPLLVALPGLLLPLRARRAAAALGVGGAAIALVLSVVLAFRMRGTEAGGRRLIDFGGGLVVHASFLLTPAAAIVAIAVGTVALAVQVYSVTYLHDDDRYVPYAAQVSLFTAAMLLVVISGDLILLLVGWEVMGICSYLLIGHDRRLPEAPAAAVKAFVVTRVGDVGFLLGIALLAIGDRSFDVEAAGAPRMDTLIGAPLPPAPSHTVLTVAALLLLAGVAGKSAQFPLHTWLPDAMAGPTPISALIHAATMVAAGVYVVARLYGVFAAAPVALAVLGVIAAITMLLGALAATVQLDIKRVLAWSTVSQVAYMAGALAVGLPVAALFHLLTHAAFKALLFLAAGAVIHSVGSNLMTRMGGLRRGMPVTFVTMTVGLAALAGLPPFSGFFSKDQVLTAAWRAVRHGGPAPRWVAVVVLVAGLATVGITGWYATRLWLRVFFGASGAPAHDPPALMRWPLVILAVPAALLGLVVQSFGTFLPWLAENPTPGELGAFDWVSVVAVLALVALGAAGAWRAWRQGTDPAPAVLANAFYVDAVQDAVVVRPVLALASAVRRADQSLVDGAVESTGRGALGLGGVIARWHRAALPRAATAVLGGALLIALAAIVVVGLR
jgi:NADH-quinone oxidoreductase subunit L